MAKVLRPNGSQAGPFVMTEMPSPFLGRYYFDYISSVVDPEGEYFVMIVSPTDNLQTTKRMDLYLFPDLSAQITALNSLIATLADQIAEIATQIIQISLDADSIEASASQLTLIAFNLQTIANSIISSVVPAAITSAVQDHSLIKGEVTNSETIAGEVLFGDVILGVVEDI